MRLSPLIGCSPDWSHLSVQVRDGRCRPDCNWSFSTATTHKITRFFLVSLIRTLTKVLKGFAGSVLTKLASSLVSDGLRENSNFMLVPEVLWKIHKSSSREASWISATALYSVVFVRFKQSERMLIGESYRPTVASCENARFPRCSAASSKGGRNGLTPKKVSLTFHPFTVYTRSTPGSRVRVPATYVQVFTRECLFMIYTQCQTFMLNIHLDCMWSASHSFQFRFLSFKEPNSLHDRSSLTFYKSSCDGES